jgi:hypothetical protein
MPMTDMTFLKAAPLNSFIAMNSEQNKILAWALTYEELKAKIKAEGLTDIVLWKNPPSWARLSL